MRDVVGKARRNHDKEGIAETVKKGIPWVYNHVVRPRLPVRTVAFNGVNVRAARLFDAVIPWELPTHPHPDRYEAALVAAVRESVEPGDRVVVIGGGRGVTTVVAADRAGDTGSVVAFEGSREHAAHVKETAEMNGVGHNVAVRHAIVSEAVRLDGERGGSASVTPGELPDCDVLEMDCEGAEIDVLEGLAIRPRVIIVETHTELGASPEDVRNALTDLSYEVVSEAVAEVGAARERCLEDGVFVLTAHRRPY